MTILGFTSPISSTSHRFVLFVCFSNARISNRLIFAFQVNPIIDACIECGFCESNCPTRSATVTPRQRIALARRKKQIEAGQADAEGVSGTAAADAFASGFGGGMTFDHAVTASCAADGMCASKCPVGINTGEYVKALRAVSHHSAKIYLPCFTLGSVWSRNVVGRRPTPMRLLLFLVQPCGPQTT